MPEREEITALLEAWRQGDEASLSKLVSIAYKELHRLAAGYLRQAEQSHTLQPTALVHEAYLRLVREQARDWRDRAHFFGVAANIMRNLLVDHARARNRGKRGGGCVHLALEEHPVAFNLPEPDELLALDDALLRLAKFDARSARVVELRYFVGMKLDEIAVVLGVSEKTVRRDWTLARTWLQAELRTAREGAR